MRLLAYGILRDRASAPLPDLTETGGPSLARVAAEGLAVAYSRVSPEAASPDLARLLAFARVVEELHRRQAILPLRHGCLLSSEAELEALLRRNRPAWLSALDEVEGCEEMGLRVLLRADGGGDRSALPSPPSRPGSYPSGAAYLAARRTQLAACDALRSAGARIVGRVLQALHGLHRRCHVGGPGTTPDSLPSLAFLVPREDLERFRIAFERLRDASQERMLLTGPWPPYHFVEMGSTGAVPPAADQPTIPIHP